MQFNNGYGEYDPEYDSEYDPEYDSEIDNEIDPENDAEHQSIITAEIFDGNGNRRGSYVGVIQKIDETDNERINEFDDGTLRDNETSESKKYKKKYGGEKWQ